MAAFPLPSTSSVIAEGHVSFKTRLEVISLGGDTGNPSTVTVLT